MNRIYILTLMITLVGMSLLAQTKKWDISNPGDGWSYKEVPLNTNEGTWMNLDVSPDGRQIVFDLLGDIYKIPTAGGKAILLRGGLPYEVQPRFSPDGNKISFTSDAGGGDNIWVMDNDGKNAKQITKESFRLLNNAVWHPDGDKLIARKHFTSGRSLGAGEMWMYHITGGTGIQLTKRKNDQQDVNEPSVSPDGRYLYYSEDVYPGGFFQYNKDPNKQIYAIQRYDFETGRIDRLTGGPGSAARPQVSRDGKKIAFVKRVRTKSVLYIHDLETGEEWPIYDQLSKDQMEAWAIFGAYTGFSWMPDNSGIIIWANGKINQINIATLQVKEIPFEAKTTLKIADAVSFDNPIERERFTVKVIRHAVTSPNEKQLVFNALGYLWIKQLPDGKAKRLTKSKNHEFEPSFSPDGTEVVYVTWDDEQRGSIMKVQLKGGSPVKLTTEKGIYRNPSYAPKGDRIVYRKEGGNSDQGLAFTKKSGIYYMSKDGKNPKKIIGEGAFPTFDKDGQRVFYQTGGYFFGALTKELRSVDLNGADKRTHLKSKYANRIVPSPDNKWVAFSNLHKVYLAPLILTGKPVDMDSKSKSFPVAQIAKDAGVSMHWSANSEKIFWTLGEEYFSNEIKDRFTFLEGSPDSIPAMTERGLKISLEVPVDRPSGILAFTGARIITMEGTEIIENGTLLVERNKIIAIGKASEVKVPKKAKVYDVKGKTIMPGIVDAHAHIGAFRYGLTNKKHWPLYANLAFGVTTSHDPSANTETIFALSEMVKSGEMVGPRIYSTGIILYGAEGDFKAVINDIDDARSAIRRTKAFGALSVKSYNQPRREQRQQVLQAAKEEGIMVVPEGGSTFYTNMSMILDGHTGIEHNIPVAPVYKDVHTLWGNSKSGYTPTLIVNYGGLNGEFYWYENTNVWENERLLNFTPRNIVDARSRHRIKAPKAEYENGHILVSRTVKNLADRGVKINLGAHGQLQGLGAHWELWLLQQGGMSNHEALQAATINGANYIGAGNDIGSLKVGKLADLLILDKNPLDDLRNSTSIKYTMINGRLYDAENMNEIGNNPKSRTKFYWESDKYNASFPWHEESNSFLVPGCSCHESRN